MRRNTLRRFITIFLLALGLGFGSASNSAAQILGGTKQLVPLPIQLPSPDTLVEITAGLFHTCARKYSGAVYCWGGNGSGQAGVGSTTNCSTTPSQPNPCVDTPNYVTQLLKLGSQIAAGDSHTCALNGGIAECWGSNSFGELGDSTATPRSTPQNVSNSPLFFSLAAGSFATCGLSQTGVYCWGNVPFHSYINGSSAATPQIMYGMTNPGFFTSLTVGSQFACFVAVGSVLNENDCAGVDNSEQLGISTTSPPFSMPTTCDASGGSTTPAVKPPCKNGLPPIQFTDFLFTSSLSPVVRASANSNYVCADTSNGNVQCVGSNTNGKLGGGDNVAHRANPLPVVNAGGTSQPLHGVTTGLTHACALDGSGYAWCWGLDQLGELGFGVTGAGAFSFAQQVIGGHKFRALAAGANHTCGIGTDNYVYCWGDNSTGQLGLGFNTLFMNSSGFGYSRKTGTPQQVMAF